MWFIVFFQSYRWPRPWFQLGVFDTYEEAENRIREEKRLLWNERRLLDYFEGNFEIHIHLDLQIDDLDL